MTGDFIQKLVDHLVKPLEVAGYTYRPSNWQVQPDPSADAIDVYSLGAVVDYIGANRDGLELTKCVVHVVSPQLVRLLGPITGKLRQREVYVQAKCENLTDNFIGKYVSHEDFMIGLQTRFVGDDSRSAVLRLLGNIKSEKVMTSGDDGVTQTVSAKAGVVLQAEAAVPNPVTLTPFRTFRDVALQPSSLFVLRAQQGHTLPNVGLFEADGGAWRLVAIQRVADWLKVELGPDHAVQVLA